MKDVTMVTERMDEMVYRMRADALCVKCTRRVNCDLSAVLSFCKDYNKDENLFSGLRTK